MKNTKILSLLLIGIVLLSGCAAKPETNVTAYLDELKTSISSDLNTFAIEKYFEKDLKVAIFPAHHI